MLKTFKQIVADHPEIRFEASDDFVWSPNDETVRYVARAVTKEPGLWSLLHEIGHGRLRHMTYHDDLQLMMMEVEAWKEAKALAANYGLAIDQDHIDDCIASYRDWLHSRSRCIECKTVSFQADATTYQCHNCSTRWKVPSSRRCITRKRRI